VSTAVLDSSAVLAVILEEPGAERVEAHLPGAILSEVVAKLRDLGMPEQTVEAVLDGLQVDIRPHDRGDALSAGFLRPATRSRPGSCATKARRVCSISSMVYRPLVAFEMGRSSSQEVHDRLPLAD
jgi:ribonuclease VapC